MRQKFYFALFFLGILATALPASGTDLTVTNTADTGSGSLRDAILTAAPGDTINFNLPNPSTIFLNNGSLVIASNLTISGPGSSSLIIDASGNVGMERVFTIASGVTVSISGLTVTGGRGRGTGGGAIDDNGGAIFNAGTLSLSDAVISNSFVRSAGIGGGGIFNVGGATLTLTNCTVTGNSTGGSTIPLGGPLTGGGIRNANSGNVTLTNTTVSNNTSHVGGGIWNNGTLTVTGSTFSGNSAGAGVSTPETLVGGGIYVSGPSGTGTISNSTFASNQGKDDGAAIANRGTLAVTHSTFSGNSNQAGGGGALSALGNTLTLTANILANATGNCSASGGLFASDGYNLSTDASCPLSDIGDVATTPAGLDPSGLQNNGGPTQTIALLSTSAARDAIPIAACTVTTDQRGVARPQGTGCDIGSFELVGPPAPTITSFTPASGPVGTSVAITGTGFNGASAVAFNGTSATVFTVNSDTEITATVPTAATTGPIAVTGPSGTANSSTNFTVISAPAITGFTPASGPVGTSVTITGTNFTNASAVTFNGTNSLSYTVDSATQITATVPSVATTGPIGVTTPGGTTISAANFTVIGLPTITGFSPQSGGVGTSVAINGTNFAGATAVTFNGTSATFAVSNNNKKITATVPPGATTGFIAVTTPNGTATSASPFTVLPAPTITDFTPTSGLIGTVVTVNGANFAGATSVMFGGKNASFIVISAAQITATVPKGTKPGQVTISVTTPGGTAVSASPFTVTK